MALRDTAADLATLIETLGLGLTPGANLFSAPLPEAPELCVSLINNGGGAPAGRLSGGRRQAYYTPIVQVRVRSGGTKFPEGQQLANALLEGLHMVQLEAYNDVKVDVSAPNYLGPDEAGRHRWGFNVQLGYVSAPG